MCRHHEEDMPSGMDQNEVRTAWWEPNAVCLIDQTKLPHTRAVVRCESVEAVAAAISAMVVRGAPARPSGRSAQGISRPPRDRDERLKLKVS